MSFSSNGVLIVGGGPAGLSAAVNSSRRRPALLIEQLKSTGRKLLATGAGKCNLTNVLSAEEQAKAFGAEWRFLIPALKNCSPEALRDWFANHGVPTKLTDGFHYFPVSERAADVWNALRSECERRLVTFLHDCRIETLLIENGRVVGAADHSGRVFHAEKVILATGGKGYPSLGGRGIGFELARQAGHQIVPPCPALVGLRTAERWVGDCTGLVLPDAEFRIDLPEFKKSCGNGELLFTHHGLSGPAVLDLSGDVSMLLTQRADVPIRIQLMKHADETFWRMKFLDWRHKQGKKLPHNLLREFFPQKLANHLTAVSGVPENEKMAELSNAQQEKLLETLTRLPLTVTGSEGWEKAMVTKGGVSLREVDRQTLESKLCKGLFFAGEVLNLHGPCGGYNLQWAFSSGFLAGNGCS